MERKEFKNKLLEKKISKKFINDNAETMYEYAIENNLNLNNLIQLMVKIDNLISTLDKAEFKIATNGMVKTKNLPKLIETFFELLNEGNIYYLDQSKINEIVKYLNGKLFPLEGNYFFDKKILKRIFYNIKTSKINLSHSYTQEKDNILYSINLDITTKVDKKSEKFNIVFNKKIHYKNDFESSKWIFNNLWTLNDLVNELKACIKWLKMNSK